ncbi:MaoC family dehydratase N-terminal domain-containing protein [Micromonospora sp. NPDC050495]|uniref:MaoC family dehydratase N-terminal domain-containing protein n=1 Tax=Micromonospora sp. NPDC050495 TaxID=3154936 RepID=UPI0033DD84DF
MPIPTSLIGLELPPITVEVERGRLQFFALAIGESNPIYRDPAAARDAGHPDLPVPMTFLFGLELEQANPFSYLTDVGVDLRHLLHGEQSFTYHSVAHAGDRLTLRRRISDVYQKKGGALDFVVKQTAVTRADGSRVADLACVMVIRNPGVHA